MAAPTHPSKCTTLKTPTCSLKLGGMYPDSVFKSIFCTFMVKEQWSTITLIIYNTRIWVCSVMNRERKVTEATIMEGKNLMYMYDCTLLGIIQPYMNSGNLDTLIVEGNSKKKEIKVYLILFLRNDSINSNKSSASWNFQSIVKSFKQVLFHLQNMCSCVTVGSHVCKIFSVWRGNLFMLSILIYY